MPVRKHIITGPDIDRLAQGIHGQEIKALTAALQSAKGQHRQQTKELRAARKAQRSANNTAESLRRDLAASRETRAKLVRENGRLKARLLNAGLTTQEEP